MARLSDTVIYGDLSVSGVTTTDTIVFRSDQRIKSDIKKIEDALAIVNALNGYRYKIGDRNDIGVIAQEVKEQLPELVHGIEEEGYSVAYANLVAVLINAVNELTERVEQLESDKE